MADLYRMRIHDALWWVGEADAQGSITLGHYQTEAEAQAAYARMGSDPAFRAERRHQRETGRIN